VRPASTARRCVRAGATYLRLAPALAGVLVFAACTADTGGGASAPATAAEAAADWSAPELAGADLVLMEVAGEPITAARAWHKLRLQYPQLAQEGPAMGRQIGELLKQMEKEQCLIRLGEERGHDRRQHFLRLLSLSRDYLLTTETARVEVWERAEPSDAEVREFYAAHPDRYRIKLKLWFRQILVATEAEARRLHAELVAGAAFDSLARAHSIDEVSRPKGGRMAPWTPGSIYQPLEDLPELLERLRPMQPQEFSEPIETERGWHLLKVDSRRDERQQPFEEVAEEIRQGLEMKREGQIHAALLDSLRDAYDVVVNEDAVEQFFFLQMDAEELFEFAQDTPAADKRVRMYANLVERFPESPRHPQALFMIAFEQAEKLDDAQAAMAGFERFLQAYPRHELAASARAMLSELRAAAPAVSPTPDAAGSGE